MLGPKLRRSGTIEMATAEEIIHGVQQLMYALTSREHRLAQPLVGTAGVAMILMGMVGQTKVIDSPMSQLNGEI